MVWYMIFLFVCLCSLSLALEVSMVRTIDYDTSWILHLQEDDYDVVVVW